MVLEDYPVAQLLRSTRRIFPGPSRIALVSSKNRSSSIILGKLRAALPKVSAGAEFYVSDEFQSGSWCNWKKYLRDVASRADLVWILVPYDVRDVHGVEVSIERMGRWMDKHLKIPSLGLSSVHPKMGVLLTIAITPKQIAKSSGQQLLQWLRGKSFSEIPVRIEKQGQLHINLLTARRLKTKIPRELLAVSTFVEGAILPYGR